MAAADTEDAITNFREVCAVDEDKAREFLSHCDNNLERAVQLFFQTGGVLDNTREGTENEENWENELRRRRGGESRDHSPSTSASSSNLSQASRENRNGVVAGRGMSWWEWIFAVTALPFKIIMSTLYDMIEGMFSFFGSEPHPPVTDPQGDVTRFVNSYNEHYTQNATAPVSFINEPFMDACKRAKTEIRVLLVFIHDEVNAASATFLRDALSSREVGDVIRNHNVLVWGVSNGSPEGKRVSHQLHVRTLPFVCLMVPRDGRLVSTVRLGVMDGHGLANSLIMGIGMVEQHLRTLRAALHRRQEDARIRAEQENEYRTALAADRAKKEEMDRKEEEKKRKEDEEKMAQLRTRELYEILERKKEELKKEKSGEKTVEGEAVRVQIRFPSGAKAERKFSVQESVESLFNAVVVHPETPTLFSLFTNFPRRPLAFSPSWYLHWRSQAHPDSSPSESSPILGSFHEEGLTQSLVVMVQDDNA